LKIRATGFAGRSSAKPEPASSHFLTPACRTVALRRRRERIKGEGERKTQIQFPHFLLNECILPATTIIRQTGE
jgi:hypothetical protein